MKIHTLVPICASASAPFKEGFGLSLVGKTIVGMGKITGVWRCEPTLIELAVELTLE